MSLKIVNVLRWFNILYNEFFVRFLIVQFIINKNIKSLINLKIVIFLWCIFIYLWNIINNKDIVRLKTSLININKFTIKNYLNEK